jgi:hypothetical protein
MTRVGVRSFEEAEGVLSRVAYVGAVCFLGLMAFDLSHGLGYATSFIQPFGLAIGFNGLSIIVYGTFYTVVLVPLYRQKAVWVLGVLWGLSEGIYNSEALAVGVPSIFGNLHSYTWLAYMAAVAVFFLASLFRLRGKLSLDRKVLALMVVMVAYPLLSGSIYSTLNGVSLHDLLFPDMWPFFYYIAFSLLLTRRAMVRSK